MTLYENTITRASNLNKTDNIQSAYEKMLEKKVFVSAYWSGNVLKWKTEDGRTGSDPMKKTTDKKAIQKHFKKVLGSDVELELISEKKTEINEKIELELVNAELNEASWVDVAKQVVKKHQFVYINLKNNEVSDDKKKGFVLLDATTANMLVQIADALGKINKEKFTKMPLDKAIDIGWKLVK